MAVRKLAISIPEDVVREVDAAAKKRGMTRSGFISDILRRIARARTDAEIARRVNEVFADPEVAREQSETARRFSRNAPERGAEW
jgi:metal-responsive CopG/Arc/MetJ family transcriptional regulator